MKRLFGILFVGGLLAASLVQAATPPKTHVNKAARNQAKKIKRQNAKARKAAKAHKAPLQRTN